MHSITHEKRNKSHLILAIDIGAIVEQIEYFVRLAVLDNIKQLGFQSTLMAQRKMTDKMKK